MAISPSRVDARRDANGGREIRCEHQSQESWSLPVLWNQNLSDRQRRSAERKRPNGCKAIRIQKPKHGEKHKEDVTNSLKSKTSLPPPQLAGVTSF